MDEKDKDKNDKSSARRPYLKPLLIAHGTLTFLAAQAAASLPLQP